MSAILPSGQAQPAVPTVVAQPDRGERAFLLGIGAFAGALIATGILMLSRRQDEILEVVIEETVETVEVFEFGPRKRRAAK